MHTTLQQRNATFSGSSWKRNQYFLHFRYNTTTKTALDLLTVCLFVSNLVIALAVPQKKAFKTMKNLPDYSPHFLFIILITKLMLHIIASSLQKENWLLCLLKLYLVDYKETWNWTTLCNLPRTWIISVNRHDIKIGVNVNPYGTRHTRT